MAEILLARLTGPAAFRRAVVIKRILPPLATKEAFIRMFLDEARIVASLRHPGLVNVQELGEEDGHAFLVMEYIAGENLATVQRRAIASGKPIDPRLAAHVVAEAAGALHAAHELVDEQGHPQALVHRDVSPQNLLVSYDGHVKLVDFGIAQYAERSTRTEPGEVKGKFEYMSPEQALGLSLDRRSDLFSLGIVLYELSTGRRLFKRNGIARTVEAICREPVTPPSRLVADYPPALERIVLRALAKDPDERFATGADLRRALLEVARELAPADELLASTMSELFADRVAEKNELLRRVDAGDAVSEVPAGDADTAVEVPVAPTVRTTPGWRKVVAASLGLAVVVAAAGLVLRPRGGTPSPPPAASLATSVPETVALHVATEPAGARLVVAGADRGITPADIVLPRGETAIEIAVELTGYAPRSERVIATTDQRLLFTLAALARPAAVSARPAARTRPAPRPAPTSSFRRFD